MAESINRLQAIDVHAHYGSYRQHGAPLLEEFMTGSAELVAQRASVASTRWTVVSPLLGLLPRNEADAAVGNDEAAEIVPRTAGLLQWVIVNPLQPRTYEQARRMLKLPHCVGIKIHPEEHCYPIAEHGRTIWEFAAEFKTIILTHSGEQRSMPQDCVPFADEFPEVCCILAHLGCGWDGDPSHQVRAIQKGRHDNLLVDTSSSRSIFAGIIEWAVREIGPERMLYGTDTPLYHAPVQRARIDTAEISDQAKRMILWDNAAKLLDIASVEQRITASAVTAR